MRGGVYILYKNLTNVLLFVLIICIYNIYQYSLKKKLYELVAWCCATKHKQYNFHELFDLLNVIYNAQTKLEVDSKYRIDSEEERSVMCDIIESYQNELSLKYFEGRLRVDRQITNMSDSEYFMFSLCSFLQDNACEYDFNNNKMYNFISAKRYEGGDYEKYSLTDYAVIYHKLYYITYLFCQKNKQINKNNQYYNSLDWLKKIIDTREKEMSRVLF